MPVRRAILALAVICFACAAPQTRSAEPFDEHVQVVERLAPEVHVLRQPRPTFAGVVGNVVIIEQSEGLVLVDTGASHGSGRRVVEAVRAISSKPVRHVVITHWHNDHPLGLSAILEAWPDAEVIAHEAAIASMEEGRLVGVPRTPSPEYEAERIRTLNEAYAGFETNELASAATEQERSGWRRALGGRRTRIADVAGTHLIIPGRSFTDRLAIPDRTTPVELLFLGRANTSGDISAWLPNQRILIAGDAVVEPIPYMFNAYPSEMLEAFDRMRALDYRVLVPGHGAPQRDGAYLDKLSGLVRDVQRQVAPLARQGVPVAEIAGRTDFTRQRALFAGSDAWLAYWFDRYALNPLIDSVHREARGERLGPPPLAAR